MINCGLGKSACGSHVKKIEYLYGALYPSLFGVGVAFYAAFDPSLPRSAFSFQMNWILHAFSPFPIHNDLIETLLDHFKHIWI